MKPVRLVSLILASGSAAAESVFTPRLIAVCEVVQDMVQDRKTRSCSMPPLQRRNARWPTETIGDLLRNGYAALAHWQPGSRGGGHQTIVGKCKLFCVFLKVAPKCRTGWAYPKTIRYSSKI